MSTSEQFDSSVTQGLDSRDLDTFLRLRLSPSALWSLYQEARRDRLGHHEAVKHVFQNCGTCTGNQGVIRKVLSAAKKVAASQAATVSNSKT